jgi:cobalamin-dependent methionine synthase I
VLIIGERINCTRKRMGQAAQERDAASIQEEAVKQVKAGAHVLDINGGVAGQEQELLPWLVTIVQEAVEVPLCLDSADPEALRRALPLCRKRAMINSITDEHDRFNAIFPLVQEFETDVIALCMSDTGPPSGLEDRLETATRLIESLQAGGVDFQRIYLDACIFPLGVGAGHTVSMLEAVSRVSSLYPEVHKCCGLSNVSHGLPGRKLLNEAYLMMLMSKGLDSAILDPTDPRLRAMITAANALLGKDEYCMEYLKAYRSGNFEGLG